MRALTTFLLALSTAAFGCASSQAPEGDAGAGAASSARAGEPGEPATAAQAAAPAPPGSTDLTERARDEKALIDSINFADELVQSGAGPAEMREVSDRIIALLEKLSGWSKDHPKYRVAAPAIILEAAKQFDPPMHERLVQLQRDAATRAAVAQTNYQLMQVKGAIQQYEAANAALPATLADLASADFDVRLTRDAWGRPMLYERRESGFALGSLGPDGERGTADDLDAATVSKVLRNAGSKK